MEEPPASIDIAKPYSVPRQSDLDNDNSMTRGDNGDTIP